MLVAFNDACPQRVLLGEQLALGLAEGQAERWF
jgi:hypothetical protein